MNRLQIINKLIGQHGYQSYLEIGTEAGITFSRVNATYKVGVDPEPKFAPPANDLGQRLFTGTSDEFFSIQKDTYDIVLIDGSHLADQCEKDILNALRVLNLGGTIVCHDMLPKTEECQIVPRMQLQWTGDVWKAWVKLRATRPDLRMCVINDDWGVGLIQRGQQNTIAMPQTLNWPAFKSNKRSWLNVVNNIPAAYLL
jgi:hypothetical protein